MKDFNTINIAVILLSVATLGFFLWANLKGFSKNKKNIGFGILFLLSLKLCWCVFVGTSFHLYTYHLLANVSLGLPFLIGVLFAVSYFEVWKVKSRMVFFSIFFLLAFVHLIFTVSKRENERDHVLPSGIQIQIRSPEEWKFWAAHEGIDEDKIKGSTCILTGKDIYLILSYTEMLSQMFGYIQLPSIRSRGPNGPATAYFKRRHESVIYGMSEEMLDLFCVDEKAIQNISFLDLCAVKMLVEKSKDTWDTLYLMYQDWYGEDEDKALQCEVAIVSQDGICLPVFVGQVKPVQ